MTKTIEVRYYAQLKGILGKSSESLAFDLPANENEILRQLQSRYPEASEMLSLSRIAVDETYLSEDQIISDFESIDVITPVSGG